MQWHSTTITHIILEHHFLYRIVYFYAIWKLMNYFSEVTEQQQYSARIFGTQESERKKVFSANTHIAKWKGRVCICLCDHYAAALSFMLQGCQKCHKPQVKGKALIAIAKREMIRHLHEVKLIVLKTRKIAVSMCLLNKPDDTCRRRDISTMH